MSPLVIVAMFFTVGFIVSLVELPENESLSSNTEEKKLPFLFSPTLRLSTADILVVICWIVFLFWAFATYNAVDLATWYMRN